MKNKSYLSKEEMEALNKMPLTIPKQTKRTRMGELQEPIWFPTSPEERQFILDMNYLMDNKHE